MPLPQDVIEAWSRLLSSSGRLARRFSLSTKGCISLTLHLVDSLFLLGPLLRILLLGSRLAIVRIVVLHVRDHFVAVLRRPLLVLKDTLVSMSMVAGLQASPSAFATSPASVLLGDDCVAILVTVETVDVNRPCPTVVLGDSDRLQMSWIAARFNAAQVIEVHSILDRADKPLVHPSMYIVILCPILHGSVVAARPRPRPDPATLDLVNDAPGLHHARSPRLANWFFPVPHAANVRDYVSSADAA